MIRIALTIAIMLAACAHPAPPAAPTRNLAAAFVASVEPDARCDAFYTNAGEHHTHSVTCRLPTKVVVYCVVADDKGPACTPLNGDAPPPPAAPPPSPGPASSPPPVPAEPPTSSKTPGKRPPAMK